MNNLFAFDFDGTLTRSDTFLLFIKFSQTKGRFWRGVFVLTPILVLWKAGIISNEKAKSQVFSWYFGGISLKQFNEWGEKFSSIIEKNLRPNAKRYLENLRISEQRRVIVSASIENWITPWAHSCGFESVIATRVEVIDGNLTGKFSTPNCHGAEKVRRLAASYPELCLNQRTIHLIAFGDSRGDKELIDFADEGRMNAFLV
ncbi:MAG: haloacid dehalogenase-like hydrolase [Culturomica sp.]|jgi:HAD superfamily hydrolase (TIGR01490 family)|nr:haloacid dehalogenase-like hydrolase [Culturomica sp.]